MANASKVANGRWIVQFKAADGSRKTIRLGEVDADHAEIVLRHVRKLIATSIIPGAAIPDHTARFLAECGDALYRKLVGVGLVLPRVQDKSEKPTRGAW